MHNRGFTIIELIIVAFIIIILLAILVTSYELGGYELELGQSAQQLVGDLQWTRQKAVLAGEKLYGIHIEALTSTYILFEDKDSNYQYNNPPDILLERIRLKENILIKEIYIEGSASDDIDIVFEPPEPLMKINIDKSHALITLWSQKTNATTGVYILNTGLVEIR